MLLRSDIQNIQQTEERRGMKPTHKSLLAWHFIVVCYYFYTSFCCNAQSTGGSTFVDLSHTFEDTTIYWATTKKLNLTITHNGTAQTAGKDYWYQSDEISAGTHGGTHMDSPCHFALERWCVSDIPLERLVVPSVVIDISEEVGDNPQIHFSPEHLIKWEKIYGKIPDGSLLLVRTGWSRFWPDPLLYSGSLERNATLFKFPSIKSEAAKWLTANRNIVGIGIDTMSIDIPGANRIPETHTTLMDKNIYGLENVNLQDPLPAKGVKVYVMPMKLKNASGAPCRILAEIPKGAMTSGNIDSSNSISVIWTMAILAALLTIG